MDEQKKGNADKVDGVTMGIIHAANNGQDGAQYMLARRLQDNPEGDKSMMIELFHAAAKQGNAEAQYKLGVCYLEGEGVHKSLPKAVKWLRKAAAQGHKQAIGLLGDDTE